MDASDVAAAASVVVSVGATVDTEGVDVDTEGMAVDTVCGVSVGFIVDAAGVLLCSASFLSASILAFFTSKVLIPSFVQLEFGSEQSIFPLTVVNLQ